MTKEKIEFFNNNGNLEIHYFDDPENPHYLFWIIPDSIINELIDFWENLKNKEVIFTLNKRAKFCVFIMYTEKFIEIKPLDSLGRTNMIGWSLPKVVVEELISLFKKEKICNVRTWNSKD
jgi:hypothetical protein